MGGWDINTCSRQALQSAEGMTSICNSNERDRTCVAEAFTGGSSVADKHPGDDILAKVTPD